MCKINLNLSKLSSDVRFNVDLFRGSRKQGFEYAPEPYYAVCKDEKIIILIQTFFKHVKNKDII